MFLLFREDFQRREIETTGESLVNESEDHQPKTEQKIVNRKSQFITLAKFCAVPFAGFRR
jgi:hypothetical protein